MARLLYIFFGILMIVSVSFSQGLNFLRYSSDSYAIGAADIGVAQAKYGSLAMHFNPAEIIRLNKKFTFDATYTGYNQFSDMNYIFLSSTYDLSSKDAIGMSIRYLNEPEQEFIALGETIPTGTFTPYESEIALAYSRKMNEHLSLGVKLGYIKSELVSASYDESVIAPSLMSLQLGASYEFWNGSKLGLAVTNIGSTFKYMESGVVHRLPTYGSIGYFTPLLEVESGFLTGNVEYKKGYHDDFDNGYFLGANLIFTYENLIDFKVGYVHDEEFSRNMKYLTMGIGVKQNQYGVDFSYQSLPDKHDVINPMAGNWNVSFHYDLGEDEYEVEDFDFASLNTEYVDPDTVYVTKVDTVIKVIVDTVRIVVRDTVYISSDNIVNIDNSDAPLILDGINFEVGSSKIKEESFEILEKVYFTLKTYKDLDVIISGHTDNTGSKQINIKLSEDRAKAVKSFLVGKGIKEKRIATKGFGPDKPIATNATRSGRAKNRRIEFLKKDKF